MHAKFLLTLLSPCLWTLSLAQPSLAQTSGKNWSMWGGSPSRNNAPMGKNIPTQWNVGKIEKTTGRWLREGAKNTRWAASLGSQTYGSPIVADGRVFIGTNNGRGYLTRFPPTVDLGCVLCFRESDGQFLWQYSSRKLATGRVHDWPQQGIPSSPTVEGDRMWFVDNRGRVVCLDTQGFYDDEDDGPSTGLWQTLLEVDSSLTGSLQRGQVPDRLRAAFQQHGVDMKRYSVKRDVGRARWKIQFIAGGKWIPKYCASLVRDQVVVSTIDDPANAVFKLVDHNFPSLRKNKIGPNLGKLLFKNGIRVSSRTPLKVESSGQLWSFDVSKNGRAVNYQINLSDRRLQLFGHLTIEDRYEADIVWRMDMMNELGVSQHNMANCSPAIFGDILYVCTSNGLDESHINLPAPNAPSFIALDKCTGKLLWSDNPPGKNILHGQWASPAIGTLGGLPQVIFPGGDGWVYSYRADTWDKAKSEPLLLWKFDANPKESKWILGGRGTRNNLISFPVIHEQRVYITVGQDPEHGEGDGHLWCIDPTKRGDISAELAMKLGDGERVPIPHRRLQAVDPNSGELAVPNPNSGVIWHYTGGDLDKDGKFDFEEKFHRTISSPAIKDGLLYISDYCGLFHCLDARTGELHWTCDLLAACWGSPVIVDDRVIICDEDGDIAMFPFTKQACEATKVLKTVDRNGNPIEYIEPLHEINIGNAVYSTPTVANDTLYISSRSALFAISAD